MNPAYGSTPARKLQPLDSATIPVLDAHNHIPPFIIESLSQGDVTVPDAVVLVEDGLREISGGREANNFAILLVVVARVDGSVVGAGQARTAPAARLVADCGNGRVVAA